MNNAFEILNSICDGCNNFVCNCDDDLVISDIIAHASMTDSSENVFKRTTIYDNLKFDSSSQNGSISNEVKSTVFRNEQRYQ